VELSITNELRNAGSKAYLRCLDSHGYEMGVGYPGLYDAHAHRGFTDIAYAPGGLTVGDQSGLMHITEPRSWFGPILFHSEFWFIKFFRSLSDRCAVPDKVTIRASVAASGCAVVSEFLGTFPTDLGRSFSFRITDQELVVEGLDDLDSKLVVRA
jgi:hypothetical protein